MGKVVAVVGAAVVLVMLGAGLVFAEAAANPPPASVLASARSFVARGHRVSYRETVTVTEPSGSASLVRTLSVSGVAVWDARDKGSADWTVSDGKLTYEYRTVGSSSHVWVRVGASPSLLAAASWVDGSNVSAFERARYASSGNTGLDPSTAVWSDALETGLVVESLIAPSAHAHRAGGPRRLSDDAVVQSGGDMEGLAGVLTLDARNRLRGFDVTTLGGVLRAQAVLTWDSGPPVSIAPPPASAVAVYF